MWAQPSTKKTEHAKIRMDLIVQESDFDQLRRHLHGPWVTLGHDVSSTSDAFTTTKQLDMRVYHTKYRWTAYGGFQSHGGITQ